MDAVLALDLGTTTGWAVRLADGTEVSGTWSFKPRRGDGAGVRFLRLQSKLDEFHKMYPVGRLVYELPAGHYKSGAADDCIKGLVAHTQSWCEKNSVPCEGVSPKEIKKFATGNGNASKDKMLAAATARWGQFTEDDNEADARWILEWSKVAA
jgi:hypothetical protein